MHHPFVICTDTGADIPWRTVQQQQIEIAHLQYRMNGEDAYTYDLGRETDLTAFYSAMRTGAAVSTIPVQSEMLCALWTSALKSGKDILHLSVSRQLSASFINAQQAREEMLLRYPERRIVLIDTRSCSIAQGMLVFEAAQMRNDGASMDEIASWLVENRVYIHGVLLPQAAEYLKKLHLRISRRGITPVALDAQGALITLARQKTLEDALSFMAEYANEMGYALKSQVMGITHADAPALAIQLQDLLNEKTDCAQTTILPMGPITGCYAGPDAVGIAFFGSRRL